MCAGGRVNGVVWSARTATGCESSSCGFHVVRFFHWRGRQRGFRERSVQHVAFGAIGRFDFYVVLHALDNLHWVAAFEFRSDVEIDERFVHPDAIFIRRAFDIYGAAGFCRWHRGCDRHEREEDSRRTSHFASETGDCWRGRVPRGFRRDSG